MNNLFHSKAFCEYYRFIGKKKYKGWKFSCYAIYISLVGMPLLGKSFRFKIVSKYLEKDIKNSKSILDLGCGLGEISIQVANKTEATVRAVDIETSVVKNLEEYAGQRRLKIIALEDNLEDKSAKFYNYKYDVIFCLAVLDYLNDYESFLNNLAQIVESGGVLYIGFPLQGRKQTQMYNAKLNLIAVNKLGFNLLNIVEMMQKNGMDVISTDLFFKRNQFFYFSKTVQFLTRFGISEDFAFALIYPLFNLIASIMDRIPTRQKNSGTEVILRLKKRQDAKKEQ